MTGKEIRRRFLEFFVAKGHKIVPSAPMVNKDDPTLMFTNAGMNQFKDYFLGNQKPDVRRIADTQKCLRVSGKHNDLEEVGRDSYHHTMFEMLGNWSFGDYFKDAAIEWAWELLTQEYGLPKDRLYATVFGGDDSENLDSDTEATGFWKKYLPEDRILNFGKKDNFWEMGETGPCGPCSEIHIDLRPDAERAVIEGATLVNKDDPYVVELWNLVFIQFNRKADGSLEELPDKHVDTGMGLERLTMAIQGKTSNYDTDIFTPFIQYLEKESGKKYSFSYTADAISDIAMRVVTDHLRAVSFAVADGLLPGNTGAGYVIRRILRRAVRYYFSFLEIKQPLLHKMVPLLAASFEEVFPELKAQEKQIAKIIQGEEHAFLHTLETGLRRFAALEVRNKQIAGEDAFELYDTFGFPIDLTRLMAEEKGWSVDETGFEKALQQQKNRARAAAKKEVGDWHVLLEEEEVDFVGYDFLELEDARVIKYRTVQTNKGDEFQVVLNKTPFYAESGGQRGDSGLMWFGEDKIPVLDTQKENDLIVHHLKKFPKEISARVRAQVHPGKRRSTESNHSATHLMHAALHQVLGQHALQKGQDVDNQRLRFDFSHFQKLSAEEIAQIEHIVNQKIRENIPLEEERNLPIEAAKEAGAMMLFGEKYGELVRMITFDGSFSRELCGGTHVPSTGNIGLFKILSETGIAAGVRRIEAITAAKAEEFLEAELSELRGIRRLFKNSSHALRQVAALQEENKTLKKQVEKLLAQQAGVLKGALKNKVEKINGVNFLAAKVSLNDSNAIKNLSHELEKELGNAVIVIGAEVKGKPQLTVTISRNLTEDGKGLDAGKIVRELAKEIKGGGGGQPFFATAGGKDVQGLDKAILKAREMI